MNIVGGFIYFFFLAETNQKTLEEIAEAYGDGPGAKKVVDLKAAGMDDIASGRPDHKDTNINLEEVEEAKRKSLSA